MLNDWISLGHYIWASVVFPHAVGEALEFVERISISKGREEVSGTPLVLIENIILEKFIDVTRKIGNRIKYCCIRFFLAIVAVATDVRDVVSLISDNGHEK